MRFLAFFIFIALAEMTTFFYVEGRIGLLPALGLALLTAIVGSALVRRAGLATLARLQQRIARAEMPARELVDGGSILVSGALLISPGFITDIIGFLLLVPAVRALVYRLVSARLKGRFTVVGTTTTWTTGGGEIIDVDPVD